MPNNVTGIGITTGGLNPYIGSTPDNSPKPEDNKPEVSPQQSGSVQVSADDTLSYMAMTAMAANPSVVSAKTYDVNKYVTPEQAARIAGFVTSFEDAVANGLAALDAEFGSGMSDEAKLALAAAMVE